jgi:GTP cyclohydrolase I
MNKKTTAASEQIASMVENILVELGENPGREGLRRTPERVDASLRFLTRGYHLDIDKIINGAVFDAEYDEMVIVKDIEVYSLCEHHMLPFYGKCHIAYLPQAKIIGLSKLPRIVDVFARRLQVQEMLTTQIASALEK